MDSLAQDQNSKRTRIEPVFGWLKENGGPDWPTVLLEIADGAGDKRDVAAIDSRIASVSGRAPQSCTQRLHWRARRASPRPAKWHGLRTFDSPIAATALEGSAASKAADKNICPAKQR